MNKADKYVLMTAAHNEAAYIENTIQSVLAQTTLPEKWVIVSDGSTDDTDRVIKAYAEKHDLIVYARREKENKEADFASKVFALRHAYERLAGQKYDFIGNLDADTTLENVSRISLETRQLSEKAFPRIPGVISQAEDVMLSTDRLINSLQNTWLLRGGSAPAANQGFISGDSHE